MHKYSEMLNRITEKMKRGLEKRLTTAHEQFKNHSELKENKPFDTCFSTAKKCSPMGAKQARLWK